MGEIKVRAKYTEAGKWGTIVISGISKAKPFEYKMTLGTPEKSINLTRQLFPNLETAIAESTHYGFLPQNWKVEKQ